MFVLEAFSKPKHLGSPLIVSKRIITVNRFHHFFLMGRCFAQIMLQHCALFAPFEDRNPDADQKYTQKNDKNNIHNCHISAPNLRFNALTKVDLC